MFDVSNSFGIPFLALVYIINVGLVATSHVFHIDFGVLGLISWIIVIAGAISFIVYVIGYATGAW